MSQSKFVSMSFALVLAISAAVSMTRVARADDWKSDDKSVATKEVRVPASTHVDEATQDDGDKATDDDKGFYKTTRERRF